MNETLELLPAVGLARDRLRRCSAVGDIADLVHVVESDLALALGVLRLANKGHRRGSVASIPEAVRQVGPARLSALAERVPVTDPLSGGSVGYTVHHLRLHCLAVQATMDRLAVATGHPRRDDLLAAALLHDIGKLVLGAEQPVEEEAVFEHAASEPEAHLVIERDRHGTDHAQAGGALARSIGLPDRLAVAIEEHHRATAGWAGMLRLADMLTLHAQGRVIDLATMVDLSVNLGLTREQLGWLLYDLHRPVTDARMLLPCPLSAREIEVLERLAAGEVYKQIAIGLGLTTSTVRSHLHRIYTRIGVADRTQAVLLARTSGWI